MRCAASGAEEARARAERPTARQTCGLILGLGGLAAIALTVGADLTLVNLLLKRLPPVPTLDLMVWLSLAPPAPAVLLALALDGPGGIAPAVTGVTWRGLAAILYLGAVATVLAYAIWGDLLRMVLLGLAVIVLPWPRQAAA